GGVWGAMSGPPTSADEQARAGGRGAPRVSRGARSAGGCGGPCRGPPHRSMNDARVPPAAHAALSSPVPVAFSEAQLAEVRRLQGLYPDGRAALLPALHLAQETFGHISLEVEEYVAGLFDLTPAHVHEVVTFYTLFFREPKGRHVVAVCHNLSCHLAGSPEIV